MECSVGFRLVFLCSLLVACGRSHEVAVGDFLPDAGPGNVEVPFLDACAQEPVLRSDASTPTPQFERFGPYALWVTSGHDQHVLLDLAELKPVTLREGAVAGRDATNGLAYILQRAQNRLLAQEVGTGRETEFSTQDGFLTLTVADGHAGAWLCRRAADHPTNTRTFWLDFTEGTFASVGHTLGCEHTTSEDGSAIVFVDRRSSEDEILEYEDWPAVVATRDDRVGLAAAPDAAARSAAEFDYHLSADGRLVFRASMSEGGFDVYNARTGGWLATQPLTAAADDFSLRIEREHSFTIIEHDQGIMVVRFASDKALIEELPGEAFIASEGPHLYTWRDDQLLLRVALTAKPLDAPRVVFESVELTQLRSQNTRLMTGSGGSLILQDGSMRIITDSGQSMTDIDVARYPQVLMFGRWSATTVVGANWDEAEPGYSRRVFLSDGTMIRELEGLYPAIESNERIITREGDRLFIWNPQSGNETTLATLAGGPIELFALEDRDELVVAHGCLEPGSEHNDLGPVYNWAFSKVALPTQRFENGGS